jgi:L-alanine-DL-glutamate epimerase-like enolase superfamily enzyme
MRFHWHPLHLTLTNPWGIARGVSTEKVGWVFEIEHAGITGRGEAAHTKRNGESLESVRLDFERVVAAAGTDDPGELLKALPSVGVHGASAAAIDVALHDWLAQQAGLALHQFLGIKASRLPITSFSIGIANAETIARKVAEAAEYPILKVKLGTDRDREIIGAVRAVTDKPLRVDANEGWETREEALEQVRWLADEGTEFVEQPLPAHRLADVAWLRERSPLPIVADEDAMTSENLRELAGAYDGINIKLAKCGGLREAVRMLDLADELGLKVMLGCMIESSLGITAAAHLGARAEWLDLDGHLLLSDDPYFGVRCHRGVLILPDAPGLGVTLVSPGHD